MRHFLAQQRPAAVSRGGSPVDTETEGEDESPAGSTPLSSEMVLSISLPNFPAPPNAPGSREIYLEKLVLDSEGKNLQGLVQVKNVSFEVSRPSFPLSRVHEADRFDIFSETSCDPIHVRLVADSL